MKTLLMLCVFSFVTVSHVFAQSSFVIDASVSHCDHESAMSKVQDMADEKCIQISGYPNAKLTTLLNNKIIRRRWGYNGCALILTSEVRASYLCLNEN